MVVEARDELGYGPHSDEARILIKVQAINSYRPVFIMPALSNASVELQEVRANFSHCRWIYIETICVHNRTWSRPTTS